MGDNKKIKSKITYARLVELFHRAIQEVKDAGIEIGIIKEPISINTRAVNFWGRCRTVINTVTKEKICSIEVSENLLYAEEIFIMTTLVHEILHTCKNCQNHSPEWTRLANIMNKTYGYNVKSHTSAEEKGLDKADLDSYKYCVECVKCHKKHYYARMSNPVKFPDAYQCKCGGKLKRIK